ncbi:putative Ser/thr kinase-related protein [Leptospira ryugenii]|uniref:Putative Ser/thr kinase-related protein n=1 Tax=Leptospira ryugenii TaxID=1917863 RepID=A0A2P2E4F9_9LEPT|nr:NAD(P)H-binding protein [Leptospira ryugenii]GBF51734.1 putative Ser/thr kinase-related protein [Leptospira ryugenii]
MIKNILLLGGTGLVGSEVLKQLAAEKNFERVFVWLRSALETPVDSRIQLQTVTWEDFQAGKVLFPKVDAVICCLGTTIKKAGSQDKFKEVDFEYPLLAAKLAKQNGAQSFLVVTALGSDANSAIFYNRVKGELEGELKQIGFPLLGIFRPSLLLGDRKEFRFGEKVGEYLSQILPFSWLGLGKYAPVQAKTVAKAMLKTLFQQVPSALPKTLVLENEDIHKIGS